MVSAATDAVRDYFARLRAVDVPQPLIDSEDVESIAEAVQEVLLYLENIATVEPPIVEDSADTETPLAKPVERQVVGDDGLEIAQGGDSVRITRVPEPFDSPVIEGPFTFPVKIHTSSGENPDFVYVLRDLDGNLLSEGIQVARAHMANANYVVADDNTFGLACYDGDDLVLLVAFDEIEDTTSC